eukprot:TRINITY_DN867_c0_g1_i4.p1 TRINITY_DN867_c0_g1~~TRINITY_DN867_c0_g1_i4.p1  ORF type:complete len:392 (-),score=4.18 TRINITY_DN867_c0_g1_i4:332-1387(-)
MGGCYIICGGVLLSIAALPLLITSAYVYAMGSFDDPGGVYELITVFITTVMQVVGLVFMLRHYCKDQNNYDESQRSRLHNRIMIFLVFLGYTYTIPTSLTMLQGGLFMLLIPFFMGIMILFIVFIFQLSVSLQYQNKAGCSIAIAILMNIGSLIYIGSLILLNIGALLPSISLVIVGMVPQVFANIMLLLSRANRGKKQGGEKCGLSLAGIIAVVCVVIGTIMGEVQSISQLIAITGIVQLFVVILRSFTPIRYMDSGSWCSSCCDFWCCAWQKKRNHVDTDPSAYAYHQAPNYQPPDNTQNTQVDFFPHSQDTQLDKQGRIGSSMGYPDRSIHVQQTYKEPEKLAFQGIV